MKNGSDTGLNQTVSFRIRKNDNKLKAVDLIARQSDGRASSFKGNTRKSHRASSSQMVNLDSESETFFNKELVWPFSSPSGMTPAMLAIPPPTRSPMDSRDQVTEQKTPSRCERLLYPKPPPRPEDLPCNIVTIRSDPPSVDVDDVEEFLVHDGLFVEYFNAFLALPAFPEPICFNMETGGFEVVSDGRQKLASQIKEAVRSQNMTPKMYRLAKKHAFSSIPLIPIEDADGPEGVEIDTSFQVTTLNKDQGIYWIKAERLPLFLESDFYFQYRLARVISQAKLFNEKKEFVIMKIDFTPRQKKVKKAEEIPPPNIEEIIVKKMYVSFGDVKGAAKEAWFTQAKDELSTTPQFTSLTPKMSTQVSKEITATSTSDENRPKSSVFSSSYFGQYTPGILGPGESECLFGDENLLRNQMFNQQERPFTPRPSDMIHVATDSVWKKIQNHPDGIEQLVKPGPVVFVQPKQDPMYTDSESGIGEMDERDEDLERRMNMQPIIDSLYHDGTWEQNLNIGIELKSLDDLGSVAVASVMKKTLAEMLSTTESVVLQDPVIQEMYPSEELTCVDVKHLERFYTMDDKHSLDEGKSVTGKSSKLKTQTTSTISGRPAYTAVTPLGAQSPAAEPEGNQTPADDVTKEPKTIMWDRPLKKSAEEESDADSLLDSDDDFEERDIRFRRKKDKWYNLTSMRGIKNFKKFLEGTSGERYWELWVDIDKGRLLQDKEEENRYSMYMRERYYKHGSPYELAVEDKSKLGLESTGRWCTEYLFQIQGKVLEPLVLYWAPRYLLRNLLQSDPEKYQVYSQMKAALPIKESDPFPMTKSLLPLRPKSCCPRTRQGPGFEEMNFPKSLVDRFKANEAELVTSPKTGNRRIYADDTFQRLAWTPTAKYLGIAPPPKKAEKSDFEKKCQRPSTASSSRSVSKADDAGSVMKMNSSRKSEASVKSGVSGDRKSSITFKAIRDKRSKDSYVGKLPGIAKGERMSKSATLVKKVDATEDDNNLGTKARCRCKSASVVGKGSRKASVMEAARQSSVFIKEQIATVPCPDGRVERIMGAPLADRTDSGEILTPVKKPRDLLSPMIRILDTKGQRSRVSSAATPRCTSGSSEDTTFFRQDSVESSKACDSRPSSGKGKEVVVNMTDCDFMGSERMEILLQALHHDLEAGKAFRKYMEKTETNQVALNCIEFWARVQDYRKLFYKDKLDLFYIIKTAKMIFAQFVVAGAGKSIEVSDSIELRIIQCLKPAYEDLFDEAEEHALKVLFGSFLEFLKSDVKTYCKVERTEITRRLETKNTYILNLQKKGIIKERPLTPDDPMEGYVDPVYDESIYEKIPEELRDWTFDKLAHNRLELEHFRQYLAENYAEIDLKCWMDMEAWRRTPPSDARKRDQRARDIKKLYLNKKYFFGPSSPAGKEGQNKVMDIAGGWGKFLEDKPNPEMILEAQKYVMERLEKKHLPLFLLTKEFQERQNPKMSQSDISDDVVVQKKRRSQAVLKVREDGEILFNNILKRQTSKILAPNLDELLPPIRESIVRLLESKWVSSTKEIFLFKQALKNPVTCQQFQKYVAIKGDNLENDLLFWLEVQRYKQMHHVHTEDAMLMQKINAIIHCFIDSPIPPSLQIDVPQEMAERILDHKHEKGPYLFRESQLATFRILLAHWTPFCEFRNNMGSNEKALKTLERHRLLAMKKEREYQDQLEKQRRERQSRAFVDLPADTEDLLEELRDEDEDKAKISFSYAEYLSKVTVPLETEDDGTQTIRGIPEFPSQAYQERPGFHDDPDVEIRAKEYNIDDMIISMLAKSASSKQGSEKNAKHSVKGDNSIGEETDELFQRHFRRSSQQSEKRRPSQLSEFIQATN